MFKVIEICQVETFKNKSFCSVTSVYICCLKSIKPFFCWEFHVDFKTTSRWLSYHFVCFVQYLKFPMSVSSVYCSLDQFRPHLNLFPREKILFLMLVWSYHISVLVLDSAPEQDWMITFMILPLKYCAFSCVALRH